ncbi:hypothetical protein TSUD_235900 [Trifolium subterraneum]|nr:hypothetical protein TSUD_235900 [Trifolium subterraneum]
MDFEDQEEVPCQNTSRSRFTPKSSKLKPKKEPELVPKLEPQQIDLIAKQNFETIGPTQTKPEPNDVKIDVEFKPEAKVDSGNVDSTYVEMTEAEDNEEDTIVLEIDVFFSPSINDNTKFCYCFFVHYAIYPLRPSWRPYELNEGCEEVRLKPDSSEVEVDLSVGFESSNIDSDVSNKLKYTKQTLSTTWKPPAANGCAAGLLMGDKLHLHPIHAVVQLRPSRHYLDSGGSEKKNVAMSNQQHAQLLHGYWVPKSSLLSPKGGAELLARNYVLVLFNKRLKVMSANVTIKKGEIGNRMSPL